MSTRPSSTDEKDARKQTGILSPNQTASTDFSEKVIEKEDNGSDVPPVSIFQLFRFSTGFELFLDIIGLVAAAAAGAAQPAMALMFGNLTQEFANFGRIVGEARAGNETAVALIPEAIREFRHTAAEDARYLVYAGIGIFVCTFIAMYIWVYTGEVNAKRIREKYLQAVLRQDIAFFDGVGAGEVSTRIQTDTHLVQQGISEKIALVFVAIGAFICGFILAYIRSWRLALALTSMLPCIVISGGIMNFFMTKYMQLSLNHVANAGNLAEEVISTVRTAQAFGNQSKLSTLYDRHVEKALAMDIKTAIWNGVGLGSVFFVIYASYGLAFSFGTTLLNRGQADAGIIINVMLSILIGSFALTMIAPDVQAIASACGAAAKLFQTIDRIPEIDSSDEGGLRPNGVRGEITLENVEFHYPSRPSVQVVKGLSITFRAGKTAALVGASGSGKSTVVSLVERFYDPTQGVVKLDGVNIKELNLKWLRSQIGLVSQEPTLFATTIRGNVAHGLIGTQWENASDEKKFELIKDACIKANADGFISKLPNGYDTMVGERGFLLSGGQKQRVAIARAIVSDPRILLLDEATSALDTQSEGVVQDALDKAAAGRTTITIAHRLSTVKDADVIYVMGDGLVLESGTHSQLLAHDGAYARLVHSQKLRESQDTLHIEDSDDLDVGEDGQDLERVDKDDIPLVRRHSRHSVTSQILQERRLVSSSLEKQREYSMLYLFKRFGAIVKDQWPRYLFTFIAAAASGCAYPAFGVVFAKGIEGFTLPTREQRRYEGDRIALWFFIIAVGATCTLAIQVCLGSSAAAILASRLRSKGFRAILRQDVEFFDQDENSTGVLTSKLSDNPQKINGLAGVTLAAIVQAIATVISGSILGLAIIWKLALVGIACTPALISTGYIRLRVVDIKDGANKKAHEESAQLACEAASSIRTVAALTREADCLQLYSQSLEAPLKRSNRISLISQTLFALSQSLTFFVIALNFWYGTQLVTNFEAGTLEFFIGLMATTFSAMSSGSVFMFVPDMSSARGAASDLLRLLDSVPDIDAESEEGKKLNTEHVKGHIRFDNIHFRYPTRPGVRVLRGLSFEVKPGTYIALVGASGSGKSTVIQLIERFYDPLAGDILLDGEKISGMNVQDYRKHIALVQQEPTLYAGTIRFNILLGATKPESEVTQEEVEDACRKANILEFIQTLPDGFNTEVGGKGSQLSGGQKQRIAIARALLRNPKVLLLDEATSALDSNSEKVVQAALDQAAKGRTTIAIAHRLSTIQNADMIYFVKEGVVSESGTHDQLIAKRGDYYEYVQLQALNKA